MKIVGNTLQLGEIDATILDASTEVPLARVVLLAAEAQERSDEIMINRVPLYLASDKVSDRYRASEITSLAKELGNLSSRLIRLPGVFEVATDEIVQEFEAFLTD